MELFYKILIAIVILTVISAIAYIRVVKTVVSGAESIADNFNSADNDNDDD